MECEPGHYQSACAKLPQIPDAKRNLDESLELKCGIPRKLYQRLCPDCLTLKGGKPPFTLPPKLGNLTSVSLRLHQYFEVNWGGQPWGSE
jgi:hypothetical protein